MSEFVVPSNVAHNFSYTLNHPIVMSIIQASNYHLQFNYVKFLSTVIVLKHRSQHLCILISCADGLFIQGTDFLTEIFVGRRTPPNILTLFRKGVHFTPQC